MEAGKLILDDGRVEAFDEALWCTQAASPAWLAETGLPLGEFYLPSEPLLHGCIPHHSSMHNRIHFLLSHVFLMHFTESCLN